MSLIKQYLDEVNTRNSAMNCPNCKVNYDDKFIETYCPKHADEAEEEFNQGIEMLDSMTEDDYWGDDYDY